MFVLIVGTLVDGVQQVVGPFCRREDAEWHGRFMVDFAERTWFIKEIDVPVVRSDDQ
jgi:hypothetical protein